MRSVLYLSKKSTYFLTGPSFNDKNSFMRSGEKAFKSLNNSIVRRCEFLWCAETELSVLFLKVLCKLIYEVYLILLFINLRRSK